MTTTVPRPKITTRHDGRELEEVLAPAMHTFNVPGDSIAGVLLSIDKVTVRGKTVTQYLLRPDGSEKRVKLLATYDLAQKLRPEQIGRFVELTFIGENKEVRKGNNCLREFRVLVAKAQNNPEINDEDIPF
jgi:hypothetical protein